MKQPVNILHLSYNIVLGVRVVDASVSKLVFSSSAQFVPIAFETLHGLELILFCVWNLFYLSTNNQVQRMVSYGWMKFTSQQKNADVLTLNEATKADRHLCSSFKCICVEVIATSGDTNFLTYIMVPTFLPLSDIRDLIQALINNHTMQEKKYHNRITYPHTFLKFASVYKLACGSSKYAV